MAPRQNNCNAIWMSIRKRWAATTPRFDVYANPDQAVTHALYVDMQSDFVRLSTRLCIPLRRHRSDLAVIQGAQALPSGKLLQTATAGVKSELGQIEEPSRRWS